MVPITIALDEHGIIRILNPVLDNLDPIETQFFNRTDKTPTMLPPARSVPSDLGELQRATEEGTAEAWRAKGQALALWRDDGQLDEAIEAYQQVLTLEPVVGWSHFRLGVLYRRRYDSSYRHIGDFQAACEGRNGTCLYRRQDIEVQIKVN